MAQPLASSDSPLGWEARLRFTRNKHFWQTLKTYCAKGKFKAPKDRKTAVLDLCCGTAEEGSVLCAYFSSGTPDLPTTQVDFFAVDADAGAMAKAREIFALPAMGTMPLTVVPSGQFITADAQALDNIAALPPVFDFILVRHQFVARDKEESTQVWTNIFKQAVQRLAPEGLMLITSFSQIEHHWCEELLQQLGATIAFSEENPHQIALESAKDIAGDKFVIGIKPAKAPLR